MSPRARNLGLGALAVLGFLLTALVMIPWALRGPLMERLQAELDQQVGATVRFDDLELSLLRGFPHLAVTVHGLSVVNHAPFEGTELAQVEAVRAVVDVRSLFGDELVVRSVQVQRPVLQVVVDAEGRWNTELGGPEAEEAEAGASELSLSLQHYAIEELQLLFHDQQAGRQVRIERLDHHGRGDFTAEVVGLTTRTDLAGLTLTDRGIPLLRDATVGWDLQLDYHQPQGRLVLKDNRLTLNALAVTATGEVTLGDALALDLAVEAPRAHFRELLSLVPSAYGAAFDGVQADGTVAMRGSIRGIWSGEGDSWPAFDLTLDVADGRFRYPDLPTGIDEVALQAAITHPGGPWQRLAVDIPRFSLRVDDQPVSGRLSLRDPGADPAVEAQVQGVVDLGALAQALPSDGRSWQGRVELDVDVAGRLSDFEAQRVDAVRAAGTVRASDVTVTDPEMPAPWHVDRLEAALDPRWVTVDTLKVRAGASDLAGSMRLDNLLSWLLAGDTLVGRGQVQSKRLDLDALYQGEDGEEAVDSHLYVIPDDLDLKLTLAVDHLTYGERDYREIQGDLRARDGALGLEDLRMKLLDGQMVLDGTYRAESPYAADLQVSVDLRDLGLAGLVQSFETLQRVVPIAQSAPGKLNSKVSAQLRLGPDLQPDLGSLFSEGRIELFGVTLRPDVLKGAQQSLKSAGVDAVQLDASALAYTVRNGQLQVQPVPLRLGSLAANLSGTTGILDRSLDLRLDLNVPVGQLAGNLLSGLGDAGTMDVALGIGGTYDRPTLKVDVGAVTGQLRERAVQEVTERVGRVVSGLVTEAKAKGDALIAAAEQQAAALVAQAKVQADQLRAAAARQGDQLVEAAAGKPLQLLAAREASKKLNAEADTAAKRVVRQAERTAQDLIAEARRQADALLEEAEARASAR